MTTENTTPTTEVTLTRREKLVKAYEDFAEKRAAAIKRADEIALKQSEIALEVHNIDALASVAVGSTVVIPVGKGEAAKDVEGTVLAVRDEEDGSRSYKVQHGSGFDTDVTVVKSNKIKLPTVAQAEQTPDSAPAAE